MNVLQLCHRVPFPLLDGGNIAMYQAGMSLLGAGHTLKILALNTRKHYVEPSKFPAVLDAYKVPGYCPCTFECVSIDTTVQPVKAFFNLLGNDSYNISRFYSRDFEQKLEQVLRDGNYDIVQLESLFMTPYLNAIRKNSKARVVMRAHNVEHIIWQRLAESEKPGLKKRYLKILVKRLKTYEENTIPNLDAILAITPEDKTIFQTMGYSGPVEVIPVGIEKSIVPSDAYSFETISLFHLGSMDWLPNIEGIQWFLDDCWPSIQAEYPDLNLFLAGRGFPVEIRNRKMKNVVCEGEIADAEAYMSDKPVMIVPLLSGSGMRVKIIQGMAAGKVIISTSIGAEGIECMHKKNILIANTPAEFAHAVHFCMENKTELLSISRAAQNLISEKYSGRAIGEKLDAFYKKLLA